MAKKTPTRQVPFETWLLLFRYFLGEIGASKLSDLAKRLNNTEMEGVDESGNTFFYTYLAHTIGNNATVSRDQLREYDERICRYTRKIGEKRGGIRWKYFQYLALLFTEMYLDRYFSNREAFCTDLNAFIQKEHTTSLGLVDFADYSPSKMNKLAYMCATGSGKTLMMHVNILQFLFYIKRAQRMDSRVAINKIIVLAPNEGMSRQHLEELTLSGIKAEIFDKDRAAFGKERDKVDILDMNKLKEEGKVKTVSVDSFERNNLVMVDEAHRGMTSDDGVWYDYRTRLSENGFAFEYSATFKQALNANSTKTKEKALMEEYGKSIIMDYSYKYFYEDGYGKDYRIYNLRDYIDEEKRQLYLTGCLLSFFQQVKYFQQKKALLDPFHIENPLLVFVGNRVTASTSKEELSDVEEVLGFIDKFVRHKAKTIQHIASVINEGTGLIDSNGNDLFQHDFHALWEIYGGQPEPATLYTDLLHAVFNTDTNSDEPRLHIENIKQVQGEIALKIGEYGEHFGVINIGDTNALIKKCGEKGLVIKTEEFISRSLFRSLNDKNSKIRILIGSRKFTEGWNSWRVSTMGLINFAKGEGSQAIQLFGRGVRLKGYEGRLKRSSQLEDSVRVPRHIGCIETLTIFGVKAQYMEEFKKFLELEGAPANNHTKEITLPVINRFDSVKEKKLRVVKLKNGANFKKQAARLILDAPAPDDKFLPYLLRSRTVIDCRSKIQAIESYGAANFMHATAIPEEHTIPHEALPLLDYYRIYDALQLYKNEKAYFNISIDRGRLQTILELAGWYALLIPKSQLNIDSILKLEYATDYAIMALKSYMDKFYTFEKARWESPLLEFAELTIAHNNFVDEYHLTVKSQSPSDPTGKELDKFIAEVSAILQGEGQLREYEKTFGYNKNLVLFDFRSHLYAPLICLKNSTTSIQVSPVSLNSEEKLFVDYLQTFVDNNDDLLEKKSLYLLRNKSKAGIGFFEAGNFYPDYILWIDTPEKQYVSFIDPKGLIRTNPTDPKIEFYKVIKDRQAQLAPTAGDKPIILNSFIMSATKAPQLREWWHMERAEREAKNVYTLDDETCVRKMIEKILASE